MEEMLDELVLKMATQILKMDSTKKAWFIETCARQFGSEHANKWDDILEDPEFKRLSPISGN